MNGNYKSCFLFTAHYNLGLLKARVLFGHRVPDYRNSFLGPSCKAYKPGRARHGCSKPILSKMYSPTAGPAGRRSHRSAAVRLSFVNPSCSAVPTYFFVLLRTVKLHQKVA